MNESKVEESVSVVIEALDGSERVVRKKSVKYFEVIGSDEERSDRVFVVGVNVVINIEKFVGMVGEVDERVKIRGKVGEFNEKRRNRRRRGGEKVNSFDIEKERRFFVEYERGSHFYSVEIN